MSGGSSASVALLRKSTGAANVGRGGSTVDADLTTLEDAYTALIGDAPATLDAIHEIADALGDDENFATSMATALAGKEASQTVASQAEAEAGIESAIRSFSPLRIAQAIAALATAPGTEYIDVTTASSHASLDFTISGDFYADDFYLFAIKPATDGAVLFARTSSDGGSSYDSGASDYIYMRDGYGTSSLTQAATAAAYMVIGANLGNGANESMSGLVSVIRPAAAEYTQIMGNTAGVDTSGNPDVVNFSGWRQSAADVDRLRLEFNSGNVASGFVVHVGRGRI